MLKKTNDEMHSDDFLTILNRAMQHAKENIPDFTPPSQEILRKVAQEVFEKHQGRTYHASAHPYNMFVAVTDMYKGATIPDRAPIYWSALYLMTLLHDVVIHIGMKHGWNEEMSADYARVLLHQLGFPAWFVDFVARGIMATATHSLEQVPGLEQPTVALFLDLDLMGLGQKPEDFEEDTESIWLEYKSFISRGQYDSGRKKWAWEFLKRHKIFHTPYFEHLEQQARENLLALATD